MFYRFKFDDDRVTPATLNQVLEDNFGGEDYTSPAHARSENRFTNAYMLVYIRESQTKSVLEQVTEKDIPSHLGKKRKCHYKRFIFNFFLVFIISATYQTRKITHGRIPQT